jgi:cell division protein FtsI/penicillin-binding protein 2
MYEPGSTFKVVTIAAALEAGLVTPDTSFTLGSSITVADRTVHEAETNLPARRNMTVTQILAKSSNVGAVTIGQLVGKTRLVDMINKFGFTQQLGFDFPGEAAGMMSQWSGSTIANVPIGQGISVTPLQLAAAYCAIANNGVMVQPHLAEGVFKPWSHQVVSQAVATELRSMLEVTVDDGTGRAAEVAGYKVAGKTGTAQKIDPITKKYSNTRYVSSFVGMVPANNPRLVIVVTVDEPSAVSHLGATVAAPAFSQIAGFCLKALEIPPTGN